nr:MAG TPA: hypothetical protein [Caudoviricetes sp.]
MRNNSCAAASSIFINIKLTKFHHYFIWRTKNIYCH